MNPRPEPLNISILKDYGPMRKSLSYSVYGYTNDGFVPIAYDFGDLDEAIDAAKLWTSGSFHSARARGLQPTDAPTIGAVMGAACTTSANLYALEDKLKINGVAKNNIVGSGTFADPTSNPARTNDQKSGIKTLAQMKDVNTFYSGKVTVETDTYNGFDFNTVWKIDPKVNGGLPFIKLRKG